MSKSSVKRIPLKGKGGEVRAFALVDYEDYPRLMRFSWHLSDRGYARRSQRNPYSGRVETVRMHRQVMGCAPGDPEIDHISRDKLDNRKCNLRQSNRTEQMVNRRSWGKSPLRGVTPVKGGFVARITIDGTVRYLGRHKTEDAAAKAVREALSASS